MTYRQFLEKLLKILKIVILIAPFVLFFWLGLRYFVPGGELKIVQDFKHKSFASILEPKERVSKIKRKDGYYQEIKGDMVYFTVKVPRRFHEAEVTVEYQNPEQSFFDLGILIDEKKWQILNKPLECQVIDSLAWDKLQENSLVLLQKEKKYNTIDDFLRNIPQDKKIATYYYELPKERILPDYQPQTKLLDINTTLRGPFIMYTYIKDEALDFTFYKQDLNWYPGPDEVKIYVFKGKEKIFEDFIEDDGQEGSAAPLGPVQQKQIQIPELSEGVYKIQLDASSDVFIRSIQTRQHLLVFEGKELFLAGNSEQYGLPNKTTDIWTNGTWFSASTPHESAFQFFSINNQRLYLGDETHKSYRFADELNKELNYVHFPISDVIVRSDGWLAFSKNSFFKPLLKNIVKFGPETNLDQTDYIIAQYTPPKKTDQWKVQKVTLDAEAASMEDREYKFAFLSPNLAKEGKEIKIREIEILFRKQPITFENFFSRLKGYIKRKF